MNISDNKESFRWHLISFYGWVENQRKDNPDVNVYKVADDYVANEIKMEEGMREYHEYLNSISRYNERILRAIKSVKGKTFYNHLTEYLKHTEASDWHFEIVSQPVGKLQEVSEFGRPIKKEWVVQHAVGDSGDSWAGTICIQLKENKYLKFHFSM